MVSPRPRLLAGMLCLVISGCGKDTPSEPLPDPTDGTMSAVIDGATWTASTAGAGRFSGLVTVTGADASGLTVNLSAQAATPGTYAVGGSDVTTAGIRDGVSAWAATSGSIVITVITGGFVEGTFSFDAEQVSGSGASSRSVVGGAFNVRF